MKKKELAVAIVAGVVTAALIYTWLHSKDERKRRAVVSDAGYETAHDIHYPLSHNKKKMRYS